MSNLNSPLEHGGNIEAVSAAFGIPLLHWLDLSTGINPYPYPVVNLEPDLFQKLPYESTQFRHAVSEYYGLNEFVAGNGSQQFIALLPRVLSPLPVLLPDLGYQEHERYWQFHGNELHNYPAFNADQAKQFIEAALEQNPAKHLLVINPNNPSGLLFSSQQLLDWAGRLQQGAMLIVDEAFMDATPQSSLLHDRLPVNVVVLRSFGKFFGLAGVRLGFAFSSPGNGVVQSLQQWLGPWNINGAAQALAARALSDVKWQQQNTQRLQQLMESTQIGIKPLMQVLNASRQVHWPLFSSYLLEKKVVDFLYDAFCQQGILLRKIEYNGQHSLLRVGRYILDEEERFQRAVAHIRQRL